MRSLVTGGAGFIGSALCQKLVSSGHDVLVVDKLTYSAAPATVAMLEKLPNLRLIRLDICDREAMTNVISDFCPDTIFHLAAESHVDRSIDEASVFLQTNVIGTFALLEAARAYHSQASEAFRFIHVSTDEVFGSLGKDGQFSETSNYDPSSPYSASKAGSDHLVRAWGRTYGLPVIISNCSNNYGPRQFPEKLIPLTILNALEGCPIGVYGSGENVRDWLFVEDHALALMRMAMDGRVGETYAVGGRSERTNIDTVRAICKIIDERKQPRVSSESLIRFVEDRPGHDQRYSVNTNKISRELDWSPSVSFEKGLEETVDWYLQNEAWWRALRDNAYKGERLGQMSVT